MVSEAYWRILAYLHLQDQFVNVKHAQEEYPQGIWDGKMNLLKYHRFWLNLDPESLALLLVQLRLGLPNFVVEVLAVDFASHDPSFVH